MNLRKVKTNVFYLMLLIIRTMWIAARFVLKKTMYHRAHVAGWHKLSQHNRTCRWGVRHNPKMELVKELKIGPLEKPTTPNKLDCSIELGIVNLVDGCDESVSNDISCFTGRNFTRTTSKLSNKKLLQFDKSHRPAYYGTWSQKRSVLSY